MAFQITNERLDYAPSDFLIQIYFITFKFFENWGTVLPKSVYNPSKLRVPVTQAWHSGVVKAIQQREKNVIEKNLNHSLVLFGKHQIGAEGTCLI